MERIHFNCGEFLPGKEPILIPGVPLPVPQVLIPRPPRIRFPNIPRKPPDRNPGGGGPGGPGSGGPGSGGPGGGIPVGDPLPPVPTPPGPGTGGQPAQTVDPGPSTGWEIRYRCFEVEPLRQYCPDGTIKRQVKRCSQCGQERHPETGIFYWPLGCVWPTLAACKLACNDVNVACITEIPVQTERPPNQVEVIQVEPVQTNVTIEGELIPGGTVSATPIYHEKYNLYIRPTTTTELYVNNNQYLNVFSSTIAEEVRYFIRLEGTNLPWNEQKFFDLTLQKIEKSLNPLLLTAFKSIHYLGGIPIEKENFLEVVRNHLLTGTIRDFDPSFYIETAKKQSNDKFIQYNTTNKLEYAEKAALGLISYGAVTADPEGLTNLISNQIKRQRRLNEDIKAAIPILNLEGECLPMPILNEGICFEESPVDIGPGHGYYFQLTTKDGECIPIETENSLNKAYYVPPEVRYNALTLMEVDPSITIESEIPSTSDEFSNQESVIELKPLYFKIDLSSVEEEVAYNPLITRSKVKYTLVDDTEDIRTHSLNVGFSTTRVNVDYDDHIYRYALNTSSITLYQNDITFRNFEENETILDANILTRNIPFAVVLTPVYGSKHNPFAGWSNVSKDSTKTIRSISLLPSFDYSDNDQRVPHVDETNIYTETSSYKIGSLESNNAQGLVYLFNPSSSVFSGLYYDGNSYRNDFDSLEDTGMSFMVKQIVDPLIETYEPKSLTWWDVYRRMPFNKFGELLYDYNETINQMLSRGMRDGVKINHVLNRFDLSKTGLLEDDDMTIRRNNA